MEDVQLCSHFRICGGCQFLDIPYKNQLVLKEKTVKDALSCFEIHFFHNIIPSEKIYFYRNKMEFVFGLPCKNIREDKNRTFFNPDEILVGLREKNLYYKVVDIKNCLLQSNTSNKIIDIVRTWAKKNAIQPYNLHTHTGVLRYLVIREAKFTGQIMVNLVINTTLPEFEDKYKKKIFELIDSIKDHVPDFHTSVIGFYQEKGDTTKFKNSIIIYGDGYITENLGNINYRISADTFFQTNSFTVKKIYEKVREMIISENDRGGTCLDLYCGCGGITLFVADLFEKIIGVESIDTAVINAHENALLNNIKNCEFVCENTEYFLKKISFSKFHTKLSTVIVDPPRAGLMKKVTNLITELSPQTIIYVSCNVNSLVRDLQNFNKFYIIDEIISVDMFPHTQHVETILKLKHR